MIQMASVLVVASVFISFWTLISTFYSQAYTRDKLPIRTRAKSTGDYVQGGWGWGVLIIGFSSIK